MFSKPPLITSNAKSDICHRPYLAESSTCKECRADMGGDCGLRLWQPEEESYSWSSDINIYDLIKNSNCFHAVPQKNCQQLFFFTIIQKACKNLRKIVFEL